MFTSSTIREVGWVGNCDSPAADTSFSKIPVFAWEAYFITVDKYY